LASPTHSNPDPNPPEPGPGEGKLKFKMAHTDRMRALDRAAIRRGGGGQAVQQAGGSTKRHQASVTEVEETKALLGLGPIFLCVCIWQVRGRGRRFMAGKCARGLCKIAKAGLAQRNLQSPHSRPSLSPTHTPHRPPAPHQMCYDPIFSLLPFPGDVMDRTLGGFKIPASSISFANTFGVMVSVAAYDLAVVPFFVRIGRPISMTSRIGWGYLVAIAALLSGGMVGFEFGLVGLVEEAVKIRSQPTFTNTHHPSNDQQTTNTHVQTLYASKPHPNALLQPALLRWRGTGWSVPPA
jgi:hypothetical protein